MIVIVSKHTSMNGAHSSHPSWGRLSWGFSICGESICSRDLNANEIKTRFPNSSSLHHIQRRYVG